MFCTKCGTKLDDNAKFCTGCGAKVEKNEPAKEPKVEEPKVEETKVEEPKVEEPKVEEPKAEEPKVAETKVEESNTEELKTESTPVTTSVPVEEIESGPNESMSPFDAPKKKGGKGIIIAAVSAAAIIVVVIILYLLVFKTMLGYNKFKKAMEDNEYKDAKKIAKEYKLDDSKKSSDAADLVIADIDEIKGLYSSDDIDLDEAQEQFELLAKIGLDDAEDDLEDADEWIKKMKDSKSQYDEGKSYYEYGSYEYAIDCLDKVDKEYNKYNKAQEMIEECKDKIVENAIENAQDSITYGSYENAAQILENTKEKVGEDNQKLKDAISNLENKVAEDAISKADDTSYIYSKLSYINSALTIYPDNEDLLKKYDEISEQSAQDEFDNNIAYKFESSYYTPEEISDYINNCLDNNSDNEVYKKKLNSLVNDKVKEYKLALAAALENGDMADACENFKYYGVLASEDDKEIVDYYKDYLSGTRYEDINKVVSNGSCYREYGYSVPNGGKEFTYVSRLYVGSYSSTPGELLFSAENIGAMSGYITKGLTESRGKVVILADKKVLVNITPTEKDYQFNVEIPEGTESIIIKWTKNGDDVNGEYFLGDVILSSKLYDSSKDKMLAKLKADNSSDKEDEEDKVEQSQESTEIYPEENEADSKETKEDEQVSEGDASTKEEENSDNPDETVSSDASDSSSNSGDEEESNE